MADGYQGGDVEGMGLIYEATHQTSMLNTMITWCDTMMKYRNDQPAGEHRVMWDGVVEPVWPSKSTTDPEAGYAGSENGDVAGHIAYCAYLILNNQALANQTNAGAPFPLNYALTGIVLYLEGRYHTVFSDPSDTHFIPLTLGIRFGR
jgi:hypothetical protein